jgi:hypothetical protein
MSSDDDAKRAVRFAASIATELLNKAEDGTKLLAVTYNYPRGAAAFWFGFRATTGALFAIGLTIALSTLIHWIFA